MYGLRELQYEEGILCGIMSSNLANGYCAPFGNFIEKYLKSGGALIYVYNKTNKKPDKEYFERYWEINSELYEKKGQLIFLCLEDQLLCNKTVNMEMIEKFYSNKVKALKKSNFEKIIVYMMQDRYCAFKISEEETYNILNILKTIINKERVMALVKYIVDDLSERIFINLISLSDYFIIDGRNDLKVYNYSELIKNALENLFIKQNYEEQNIKELKKVENLKNMGQLFQGIIHDFNNLLSTIIGVSQICMLKSPKEGLNEYFNTIYKTSLDGKAILNKVQSYIRGITDNRKGFYNINNIVETSISMARYRIKSKKIVIKSRLNSDNLVYCNEHEIRQVVLNLLLNSIDSIEEEGVVTVSTYNSGGNTCLRVEDTGVGMDKLTLGRIFEPYFTTKGDKGNGLGLNISKQILEEHDATIKVESKLGNGSRFTITFTQEAGQMLAESNAFYKGNTKVLIIEDSDIIGRELLKYLSILNINGKIEIDKNLILKELSENEYELVICNFNLSNLNPLEISEEIKEKFPDIPFVLLMENSEIINEKYLRTVDFILRRPFTTEELAEIIRKCLKTNKNNEHNEHNICNIS